MNIAVTMITMPFWYKLLKKASWFGAFQRVFLLFALYPFLHMLIDRSNYLFLLPVTLLVYQAMLAGEPYTLTIWHIFLRRRKTRLLICHGILWW